MLIYERKEKSIVYRPNAILYLILTDIKSLVESRVNKRNYRICGDNFEKRFDCGNVTLYPIKSKFLKVLTLGKWVDKQTMMKTKKNLLQHVQTAVAKYFDCVYKHLKLCSYLNFSVTLTVCFPEPTHTCFLFVAASRTF